MSLPTPPVASPPFAAFQNGTGISLIYQSSSDQTLWMVTSSSAMPTGQKTDWSSPEQSQAGINVGSSPAALAVGSTIWVLYQGSGGTNLWYVNSLNWNGNTQISGPRTNMAPGLTQISGTLYAPSVSSIGPPNNALYMTTSSTWNTQQITSAGSSVTSSFTPAVAALGNQICLVYGSASSLSSILSSDVTLSSNGTNLTWTSTSLPWTTTCTPSLVNAGGTLYLFALGNNSNIWFTASGDGKSWQGSPFYLPPGMTTNFSPVAVVSGNYLYIFYASSANDGTIWYTRDTINSPSGQWQGPYQLAYQASPQATTTTAVTFGM